MYYKLKPNQKNGKDFSLPPAPANAGPAGLIEGIRRRVLERRQS